MPDHTPTTGIGLKSWLVLALSLPMAACTTVEDFRKMSPGERAERVCARQPNIKGLVAEKEQFAASIQAAQADLARGYKVHRQCGQVKVYGNPTTSCQKIGNQVNCTEYRPESHATQCQELPVGINAELEKEKIQSWTLSHRNTELVLRNEWQKCYGLMEKATPEEAYGRYQ